MEDDFADPSTHDDSGSEPGAPTASAAAITIASKRTKKRPAVRSRTLASKDGDAVAPSVKGIPGTGAEEIAYTRESEELLRVATDATIFRVAMSDRQLQQRNRTVGNAVLLRCRDLTRYQDDLVMPIKKYPAGRLVGALPVPREDPPGMYEIGEVARLFSWATEATLLRIALEGGGEIIPWDACVDPSSGIAYPSRLVVPVATIRVIATWFTL